MLMGGGPSLVHGANIALETKDDFYTQGWFAHYDLYSPKWSKHIFDEWVDVMIRKGMTENEARRRTAIVGEAFPDALVENYVCGFANAQGGVIFIGKDDNGTLVGIDDYKKLMDDIPNKIRNAMGIMVEWR